MLIISINETLKIVSHDIGKKGVHLPIFKRRNESPFKFHFFPCARKNAELHQIPFTTNGNYFKLPSIQSVRRETC